MTTDTSKLAKLERAVAEERARLERMDPAGHRLSRSDLERLERAVEVERGLVWERHGAAKRARRNG